MNRHQTLGAIAGAGVLGPIAAAAISSGNYITLAASLLVAAGGALVLSRPLIFGSVEVGDVSNLDARSSPLSGSEGASDVWDGIPYGFSADGEQLTATMQHMLIAGAQGSGKSVMINNLLAFLTRDPNVRLALVDGKGGLDQTAWSPCAWHFDRSTQPETFLKFLLGVIKDMRNTYSRLVELGLEEITPDCGLPINYIVVDEVANFTEGAVAKMNTAIKQALGQISMQGRAAGFYLILATQQPSVSAIPSQIRNNLPQRFCFRVETNQASNMVLGGGMAAKGYDASKIHMLTERGVGYCTVDGRPTVKFRAYLVNKEDKLALAEVSKNVRSGNEDTWKSAAVDEVDSAPSDDFSQVVDSDTLIEHMQSVWCTATRLHNSIILGRLKENYSHYENWSAQRFGQALSKAGLARYKVQFSEPGRVNHWGLPKSALFAHTEPNKTSSQDRREREKAAFDALDDLQQGEYLARLAEVQRAERCGYCKRAFSDGEKPTVDHLIPLNGGGGHDPWNLVPACQSCNSSKRDTPVYEWINRKKMDL